MKPLDPVRVTDKKQPSGLYVLFGAEIWERFGFYFVQSIMVLYLTAQLSLSDSEADNLYSAFTAALYAAPVLGGLLADSTLGFRRAIILGSTLYTIGYFLTIIHGAYGFYLALSLLVCGNGYFKANVSSLLGTLYTMQDPRRDSGFTLFYFGINIGSFLGPIAASIITVRFGYQYGFAVCGIGMLIGLAIFLWGKKKLGTHGIYPGEQMIKKGKPVQHKNKFYVYFGTLLFALGLSIALSHLHFIRTLIAFFCFACVIYLLYIVLKLPDRQARLKIVALLILFIFSILFWAFYMQLYTSVTLFTDRDVNRVLFGVKLPTSLFQSIIPVFVMLLSPFAAKLWLHLGKSYWNPSFGMKFCLGHVFQGICFLTLVLGMICHNENNQVSMIWLVISGFFRVVGELALSPIGLSAVTRLSPLRLTGMMMGLWFLTLAAGSLLGGYFAQFAAIPTGMTSPVAKLYVYSQAFTHYALLSFAAAAVLFLLTPLVKRLSGEH